MNFGFSEPEVDGPLQIHWDVLLRIVGEFTLSIGDKSWFREENFCLVEFAHALTSWLEQLCECPTDFVYASLEADDELLRFVNIGSDEWKLLSPFENYREERAFPTKTLSAAAEKFVEDLGMQLPQSGRVLALLAGNQRYRALYESWAAVWPRDGHEPAKRMKRVESKR